MSKSVRYDVCDKCGKEFKLIDGNSINIKLTEFKNGQQEIKKLSFCADCYDVYLETAIESIKLQENIEL